MGFDKRPPLPAPTEPSTLSSADHEDYPLRDDVDTNVSARTDKTSYSIPEDGTPVTINTTKPSLHKKYPSQTSLLIEYFEAGKENGQTRSRPTVRVRVTPSSRKKNRHGIDQVHLTHTPRNTTKPAYTRRISLQQTARSDATPAHPHPHDHSDASTVSSLPPVDIEVLHPTSDLSTNGGRFVPMASDISSMPADSMLEGTPEIMPPGRRRSRSLERDTVLTDSNVAEAPDMLQAPKHQRSRSLSKDRITQRVMEKLQQQQQAHTDTSSSRTKTTKKTTREELTSPRKSSRRRSKDPREDEVSATESSLLSSNADRRSGVASVRSGVSGTSSINNPKLLATVEDAIRRLILPELNALKEENRTSKNRDKFERMSRDSGATYETVETTSSRDPSTSRRRVSKSSSVPNIHGSKPKVVLNRDGENPGEILSGSSSRKERRSSRGSTSDRSYADSSSKTATRENSHKRRSGRAARDAEIAALGASGLTAAALKHHTSREEQAEERKHRKKHSSRSSRSQTTSVADSAEQEEYIKDVPPLPFIQSELHGSELTRDSILSAETETKGRSRSTSKSSNTTGAETPLREVPRGYPSPAPHTPTRTTPTGLQRSMGTSHSNHSIEDLQMKSPRSDRSYGSRSRGVGAAGLEAAAAAKARAIERSETQHSHYEIIDTTPTRGLSPIQSEASYREDVHTTGSPRHLRSVHSNASVSSLGRHAERQPSNLSIRSLESTASTKAARTRKRPQGVNLESVRSTLGSPQTPQTPRDAELFFERNHEQNEMYRRELEESSQLSQDYPVNYNRMTNHTDDSDVQYLDQEHKVDLMHQDIRRVGASPEYIHTPLAVESAVASLHDPSSISVRSSAVSTPMREAVSSPMKKSRLSQVSPAPSQDQVLHIREDEVPSGERWGALREKAEAMAHHSHPDNSPRQSIAQSFEEQPEMHHSAFPVQDHMMPEIGYGLDNESEISTNPSIIQGPLNGGDGYYDHTEELMHRQDERERTSTRHSSQNSFNKSAALGAGAGGAAIAAAAAHHLHNRSPSIGEQHQATVEDDYESYTGDSFVGHDEPSGYAQSNRTPVSGTTGWKDEGYQSANQREGYTPQNRNHSKVFDDEFADDYDERPFSGEDVFASNAKHGRHFSGNSHGMASPLYDAATGKGIDRIQSKDIVALMDHLTVRDAQRNARDTEILVTLVRSAAEMRNQLDELKGFIKVQDNMIMNTTDKRVDIAEQRILGGPRPQPFGSPRVPRSSSDDMDVETKKKNVFKRALKGLSLKGDSDIKNIEAMLMQLLGDVEGLKQVQQLQLEQHNRSNSLTSYENLRASGDPGYEPEGRADTSSSPHQSGYLSNAASSSRRINDLHSGYDVVQTNRISTVHEDDEEYLEREPRYENTERMTTPTQEAFHNRSLSQDKTPPQAARTSQSQDDTPKKNKHKSNSSSIFGIPKISRWSKTTSSTEPRNSVDKRPYSSHSRSSSQKSFDSYDDEYSQNGDRHDDRLRSKPSLARTGDSRSFRSADDRSVRSPSPLIPEEALQYEMEDPKYQAHRNSLNLQHPQPRAGPTGRHQNHLETQAQVYEPSHVSGVTSPDYDQWGSMPSLARNRMSAGTASYNPGNLSPISSDGGHSASEQIGQSQKVIDDGPLIPPNSGVLAGYGQTRQMYSSPNEFGSQGALTPLAPIAEVRYSLETDSGRHRSSPTPSPRPSTSHAASPQRKITGPRPMGPRSPAPQSPLRNEGLARDDTVIRRKPVGAPSHADTESLLSYRTSLDGSEAGSETF